MASTEENALLLCFHLQSTPSISIRDLTVSGGPLKCRTPPWSMQKHKWIACRWWIAKQATQYLIKEKFESCWLREQSLFNFREENPFPETNAGCWRRAVILHVQIVRVFVALQFSFWIKQSVWRMDHVTTSGIIPVIDFTKILIFDFKQRKWFGTFRIETHFRCNFLKTVSTHVKISVYEVLNS